MEYTRWVWTSCTMPENKEVSPPLTKAKQNKTQWPDYAKETQGPIDRDTNLEQF